MLLSIIVPTKNRNTILRETLASAIEATRHIETEIIVVNDSKDSRPAIQGLDLSRVKFIDNPKSGVASARNLGAKNSSAELLLFLDDDIQVSRASVDHMLAGHAATPDAVFNPDWSYPLAMQARLTHTGFGRFLLKYNLVSFKGWYSQPQWRDDQLFESPLVASFHLSISKKNFELAGGYNELFPHAGFEDYDFPVRLRKMGMKLLIDTRMRVHHNEEDRLDMEDWLRRQVRGGETRRTGVGIGYNELAIHYPGWKKATLSTLLFFKSLLVFIAKRVPNSKTFDPLFFRLVVTLQAICIFEGYQKPDEA